MAQVTFPLAWCAHAPHPLVTPCRRRPMPWMAWHSSSQAPTRTRAAATVQAIGRRRSCCSRSRDHERGLYIRMHVHTYVCVGSLAWPIHVRTFAPTGKLCLRDFTRAPPLQLPACSAAAVYVYVHTYVHSAEWPLAVGARALTLLATCLPLGDTICKRDVITSLRDPKARAHVHGVPHARARALCTQPECVLAPAAA